MRGRRSIAFALTLLAASGLSPAALAQTPDDLYASAVKARQEQRFDDAVDVLNRLLTIKPDDSDALVQMGFAQLGRNDLAEARSAFSRALVVAPAYSDARFGLAEVEFRSGNLDAAQSLVEPLAAQQPGNADIAGLIANITKARAAAEVAARQPPAAATARKRPAAAKPDPVAGPMAEGRRLRLQGDFAGAEQAYLRALKIEPRNTDLLVALGLVSGNQQKFDAAARYFDAALAIRPDLVDARLGQARLALWQGYLKQASSLVDRVLASSPGNVEALALSARVALDQKDYERAGQIFTRIHASAPDNAEAIVGLGDVRRAQGDEEGARAAFRQALALEPGSRDIEQRLAAPAPRKWRLDLGTEVSALTSGLGSWTDSSIGLSYRLTPDTTLGGRTRVATRYGATDIQLEARLEHVFSPVFSGYGLVAATPDADFLAQVSVGGGASWQALGKEGDFGPLLLNIDARYDVFSDSEVTTLSPWLQTYLFDGKLGLSARWIHAFDDAGTKSDGYALRADLAPTSHIGLFVGYSDAPEISEGSLVGTQTTFAGISWNFSDDLTLRGSVAHEKRPTFDRNIFGLGLSKRF
ncbi:YaiO family outer membrane beta-barrel protein [Aminobacter sp. MET-1]|uniref:YaiO family outer membrane beta-barrel protein n=1 Tax=Aminobacter sp. MET-1 TaxID=2951085 RepID=UPI0022698142|nr:YaiO family outer membrane beta-barrel protein [Aminobacter sp. MET-1]MCX8568369.1 YaiO family outer membrane beta-barrel protein [Aminobacter sp. MET-1]